MRKVTYRNNERAEFLTLQDAMQTINLGRALTMRVAEEAGAIIHVGRCMRIDKAKLIAYMSSLAS